ncbi:DASH family cryptochrome [Jeotgalibacillus alimentarius]|uniref:Cryptochrome DASH n=1 Tax=Jeotgalibacillus alimentarius TaxID=135826 RepID=A0A0C2RM47_9BACL|nr:DASH family cryptochrome [Jeotgalibacillus alimentarius]KIL42849.1 DASH family cryptochrome [Jeotgalibacillus alimentarius]
MEIAAVWFRNDLRTIDHQPLRRAVASGLPVVGVYVLDPEEMRETAYEFKKMEKFRAAFIRESLEDLRRELNQLHIPLMVRTGDPAEVFGALNEQYFVKCLYLHEEVGSEEQAAEHRVRQALQAKISIDHGRNLYDPMDLPFDAYSVSDTFSQFRKRIEKNDVLMRPPLSKPSAAAKRVELDEGEIPSLSALGFDELDAPLRFRGGMTEGLKRIEHYFFKSDQLRIYKETRNGMLKEDDSSKLSPWLARGCLSPRMVMEEVRRYEDERVKNSSTYWLYFELLWRDYFHLVHRRYGDDLFAASGLRERTPPWDRDETLESAWMNGKTGYPLVDAAMRELAQTGFMSNRARQNVASFLTKNLGLDWRIGAAWFESLLIDYDVASNYGNWLYQAGVGNDAVQFRAFNVVKQARDYDPDGVYLRTWLPELRKVPGPRIFAPHEMTYEGQQAAGVVIGRHYPAPVVDLFESVERNKVRFLDVMK